MGGDAELLKEVIEDVLEESEVLMRQIEDSVRDRDGAALRRAAHALRGMLLTVGVRDAAGSTLELERMGTTEDLTNAEEALEELSRRMQVILPLLKEGLGACGAG